MIVDLPDGKLHLWQEVSGWYSKMHGEFETAMLGPFGSRNEAIEAQEEILEIRLENIQKKKKEILTIKERLN